MPADDRWTWLRSAAAAAAPPEPSGAVRGRLLAGLVVAVARRSRVRLPDLELLSGWGPPLDVAVPEAVVADPWLVGEALEVLLDVDERRRRGSHHTPRSLAGTVARLALGAGAPGPATTVCDPAVGGGVLLLAVAEALHRSGLPRRAVVRSLAGTDVDPLAVAVTAAGLCLWAEGERGAAISCGDALSRPAEAWQEPAVVVGNPPFLGQLRTATTRSADRSGLRPDLAALARPYTDSASLFAALATGIVAPGGRVALVLPRSFLAARDAGPARAASTTSAALVHLWLPGRRVFGAAVDVCVPVWSRRPDGSRRRRVSRSVGVPPVRAPAASSTAGPAAWSHLLTGLDGQPDLPSLHGLRSAGVLGHHCTATAGFRDQYYGLLPFVVDDPERDLDDATHQPLVTCGLIDPARSEWGMREARYGGRRWAAPRVDATAVVAAGGSLARWVQGKRVPKLLVAAQTRTIEAVADSHGTWLPSTPVATVVPAAGMQWHVLAVLLSPVATVSALLGNRGSGLSQDAIRLPPAALRALPTPADRPCWDAGAAAVREASRADDPVARSALLAAAGVAMCHAYGIDPGPTVPWWQDRLPRSAGQLKGARAQ